MQVEEEFLREIGSLLKKHRIQSEWKDRLVFLLMVVSWLGLIVVGIGLWVIW